MKRMKKLKGEWRDDKGRKVDFDALDVMLVGCSEYQDLLVYRNEYWRVIKILRDLIPAKPTYNITEMLADR